MGWQDRWVYVGQVFFGIGSPNPRLLEGFKYDLRVAFLFRLRRAPSGYDVDPATSITALEDAHLNGPFHLP